MGVDVGDSFGRHWLFVTDAILLQSPLHIATTAYHSQDRPKLFLLLTFPIHLPAEGLRPIFKLGFLLVDFGSRKDRRAVLVNLRFILGDGCYFVFVFLALADYERRIEYPHREVIRFLCQGRDKEIQAVIADWHDGFGCNLQRYIAEEEIFRMGIETFGEVYHHALQAASRFLTEIFIYQVGTI